MAEQFISEPIIPAAGTSDPAAMSRGEPGLPSAFVWRGKRYEVAETIEAWKESGPCRSGGAERYLRKHWWRIRTGSGLEMTIYFERQPRSKRQNKTRWWLYTAAGKEKHMSDMTACCGLICSDCGAFIATQNDDDEKRKEVAELWSKQFGCDIDPQTITCDGCTSGSDRLFSHCGVCEIRKCAVGRDAANCAYCDEYACEKLEGFFKMAPDAKKNLGAIRSAL